MARITVVPPHKNWPRMCGACSKPATQEITLHGPGVSTVIAVCNRCGRDLRDALKRTHMPLDEGESDG